MHFLVSRVVGCFKNDGPPETMTYLCVRGLRLKWDSVTPFTCLIEPVIFPRARFFLSLFVPEQKQKTTGERWEGVGLTDGAASNPRSR